MTNKERHSDDDKSNAICGCYAVNINITCGFDASIVHSDNFSLDCSQVNIQGTSFKPFPLLMSAYRFFNPDNTLQALIFDHLSSEFHIAC